MSDKQPVVAAYPRLSIAFFLQYAIWASYAFALTGFVQAALKFSDWQVGWIGAAIPIGAIIAPLLVGPIADRYFSAQKVLAFLHLIAGLLLCYAGFQTEFVPMLIAMIAVGMCYTPTIALMNSIVFENIPNRDNAPRVFMFGTIGWIAIVLFIQAFFGGGGTNQFFFVGAGCCFILAVYALTLPNTPPKGASKGDTFGLKAFTLFQKPSFLVFVLMLLLAGIPACGLFFTVCVPMLRQNGYPAPLALTTINQFSEVLFMALLPFFVTRFGLKKVLLIGIAAWFLRYFCFMEQTFTLAIIGLLLHGLGYAFLYVAAYTYADRVASEDTKASMQSFMIFLLQGVCMVCGSVLAGFLMDANAAQMTSFVYDEASAKYEAPADVLAEAVQVEATAEQVAPTAAPEEAAPADQAPAEEAAPADQAPAEEAAPADQAPAEETAPADQAPAEEPAPADQAPAEETAPADQAPAEEPAPADQAPAEETAPAAEPAAESESTSTTAPSEEPASESTAPAKENNKATEAPAKDDKAKDNIFPLPPWTDPKLENSVWQYLDLSLLVTKKEKKDDLKDFDVDKDNTLTINELNKGMMYNKDGKDYAYSPEILKSMLRQVYAKVHPDKKDVADTDIKVTLAEYQKIQCNNWSKFYRIPMIMLGLGFLLFLFFGENPPEKEEKKENA